jgi:hypothetical protein
LRRGENLAVDFLSATSRLKAFTSETNNTNQKIMIKNMSMRNTQTVNKIKELFYK